MADLIKKMFSPESGAVVVGQVSAKKASGLWLVIDRLGRVLQAQSGEEWRPGKDWVRVVDGRIVDRARRRGQIKKYSV